MEETNGARQNGPPSHQCIATLVDDEGAEHPVRCHLRHQAAGPGDVEFVIRRDDQDLAWLIPRRHLSEALYEPSGHAGVHLWPTTLTSGTASVAFELADEDEVLLVLVPSREVAAFVALTQ